MARQWKRDNNDFVSTIAIQFLWILSLLFCRDQERYIGSKLLCYAGDEMISSFPSGRTNGRMDEMIRYSRKILFSYWFLSRWIIDKRKICTLVSIYPPPPLPHCASSRHHHQLCHLVPFYTEDDTITWFDRARQMEMLSGGDFLLQQQFLPEITIYHWLASWLALHRVRCRWMDR